MVLPALAADDPSEMFLNAYLAVQQGEKLEGNGQNSAALAKFRFAASLLQQVQEADPNWQPLIVDYRRQKTGSAISRVEEKIQNEGTGEPSEPPSSPNFEAPLPEREPEGPRVTFNQAVPSADPLERMTSEIRQRMERLQSELDSTRQEVTSLRTEKDTLTKQLQEAQRANREAQVNEAQLRSQLQQAQSELSNARTDSLDTDKLQKQVDELSEALLTARAEREAADEMTRQEIARQTELRNELAQARSELENARQSSDVRAMEKLRNQVSDLTAALADTRAEREAADELVGTIRSRLVAEREASSQKLAAVTAERDDALLTVETLKKSQEQMEQLVADNRSLTDQLTQAQQELTKFNENLPNRDAALAALKTEIEQSKVQLAEAQKQSREYQTAMVGLQGQLDELRKNAGEGVAKENELLRGIVMRQLKDQARRDQAKKLVMTELAKLETKSDTLMQQIDYLSEPVVQLTDEEKKLFRAPQIGLSETEESSTGSMSIDIAAPKAGDSLTTAPSSGELFGEPAATPAPGLTLETEDSALPYSPFDAPLPGESLAPDGGLATGSETIASPQVETSSVPNVPPAVVPVAKEAREAFEKGDFREAEKLFEKVLAEAPNNLYALSNLGVARYRGGKLRLAEEALKKAIAIDPDDSFSSRTLGIVLFNEGRYDDAIDALTKALAISPKDAIAHNYLGIAASQKGWPEAALKEMETAVALDPNYADAHFNLAVIHVSARPPRKEAARQHYDKAIELGAPPDATLKEMLK